MSAALLTLRTELVDIQRGKSEDKHGWTHKVI